MFIEPIRRIVRHAVRAIAILIDGLSGHAITPNTITIIGACAHIGIALLIAMGSFVLAAILLLFFGLFDTLDGELARVQKKTSAQGTLLDASTDRFKEVLLCCGAAFSLAMSSQPVLAVWAVAACGASICVSYIKAKGEAIVAASGTKLLPPELNRLFSDGFATFEVRVVLFAMSLLLNLLPVGLVIIALLSSYTALRRLYTISRELSRV